MDSDEHIPCLARDYWKPIFLAEHHEILDGLPQSSPILFFLLPSQCIWFSPPAAGSATGGVPQLRCSRVRILGTGWRIGMITVDHQTWDMMGHNQPEPEVFGDCKLGE